MKAYQFECEYCGHVWNKVVYYVPDAGDAKCPKCDDKQIKISKFEKKDYYGK